MPIEKPRHQLSSRDQKMIQTPPGISQRSVDTYIREHNPTGTSRQTITRRGQKDIPSGHWFG